MPAPQRRLSRCYNPADIGQNYLGDLGVAYSANTEAPTRSPYPPERPTYRGSRNHTEYTGYDQLHLCAVQHADGACAYAGSETSLNPVKY